MSRINTNVSSLIAQKTLSRSNNQLQEALNRLSTGIRINSGKDDPAGLIASENLRRDITASNRAIGNTERANQLISTADSALGQISSLLNDVRGLVTEAANSGVLSSEQIAANQLQVDSSLEAIDRIAQVTTFQGRNILDGSLDFTATYAAGGASVSKLNIQQANLGAAGQVDVAVDITAAATQALITNTGFSPSAASQAEGDVAVTGGNLNISAVAGAAADGSVGNATDVVFQAATDIAQATNSLTLTNSTGAITLSAVAGGAAQGAIGNDTDVIFQAASGILQADGTLTLANGAIDITAVANTAADGAAGNNLIVDIYAGVGALTTTYDANTNTITINNVNVGTTTVDDIQGQINGLAEFNASIASGAGNFTAAGDVAAPFTNVTSGGASGTLSSTYNAGTNTITVNVAAGSTVTQVANSLNGLADFNASVGSGGSNRFNFSDFASLNGPLNGGSDGTTTASYAGNTITVNVALGATIGNVATAVNGLAAFDATATSGSGAAFDTGDFGTVLNPLSGGVDAGLSDVLDDDLVFKLSGSSGSEVFQFNANSTITQVVDAINLVSDATGVEAADNGGVLELRSTNYGSQALVDVEVIDEGAGGGFEAGLSDTRTNGADIVGTINGFQASGNGNTLSINTSTLDLNLTVADGSSTDVDFTITGGGAIFQLGPEVVSNQQSRIGVEAVNTASLGGVSGRLYELRAGNAADLSSDTTTAAKIVDEAISAVTELRGRLGAFQRTTLDTNIASLNDTITNLTEAESSIRDADFAQESARLTRAQILVQSGTAVLSIANQNPQQVLSLLR